MARGWESKSIEEQQSEFQKTSTSAKSSVLPEQRRREQQIQALHLKRAHVAEQLKHSQNDRFTQLMLQELAHLERELAKLSDGSQ